MLKKEWCVWRETREQPQGKDSATLSQLCWYCFFWWNMQGRCACVEKTFIIIRPEPSLPFFTFTFTVDCSHDDPPPPSSHVHPRTNCCEAKFINLSASPRMTPATLASFPSPLFSLYLISLAGNKKGHTDVGQDHVRSLPGSDRRMNCIS